MQLLKKMAVTAMGLLMTGATLMGSVLATDLGDYPAPFAESGSVNSLIVVGADAATDDVVGAINVGARLAQSGAESQTVTVSCAGGAATTVTGGANLATTTKSLYIADNLATAKSTLTKSDLSTVLESTRFDDLSGTAYKYDQYLDLGSAGVIKYGKPTGQTEPFAYIELPSASSVTTTNNAYNAKVVFNDPINLSDSNVRGSTLTLFGVPYTIGSASQSDDNVGSSNYKIILYGSGNSAVINGGETKTVDVDGTSHTIKLVGASSSTIAVIELDGVSKEVTEKYLYTINGVETYIRDVYYLSTTDQTQNQVVISLGSSKITLQNGQQVKRGTSDTAVDGTSVSITASADEVSAIEVAAGAKSSSEAFIKEGESFTDPIFGTFKVTFSGYTPSLDSTGRDTISFGVSGNDKTYVKFTDFNGNEKSIDFAKDAAAGTSGTTLTFEDANGYGYVVVENESIDQYDYFVVDAGDFSHLFQFSSASSITSPSSTTSVTLKDIFTGTNYVVTLGGDLEANKTIDGQTYYINVSSTSTPSIKVNWKSTSTDTRDLNQENPGQISVFPGIKAKNGEYVYLVKPDAQIVALNNTWTEIVLPTSKTTGTTATSILNITYNNTFGEQYQTYYRVGSGGIQNITTTQTGLTGQLNSTVLVGRQYYFLENASVMEATTLKINITPSGSSSNSGAITQPSVIIKEEENDNSQYETILVTATDESTTAAVSTTLYFSSGLGTSYSGTSTTDSSITKYLNLWGTRVDTDTDSGNTVAITYPDTQVYANVYLLEKDATAPAVQESATSATCEASVPTLQTTGVGKLDTEISNADKEANNLILVGGPAVNDLVKSLADAGKSRARGDYVSGEAYIEYIDDAFADGKVALVVAGYDAADTKRVCYVLQNYDSVTGLAGTKVTVTGTATSPTVTETVEEAATEETTEE